MWVYLLYPIPLIFNFDRIGRIYPVHPVNFIKVTDYTLKGGASCDAGAWSYVSEFSIYLYGPPSPLFSNSVMLFSEIQKCQFSFNSLYGLNPHSSIAPLN